MRNSLAFVADEIKHLIPTQAKKIYSNKNESTVTDEVADPNHQLFVFHTTIVNFICSRTPIVGIHPSTVFDSVSPDSHIQEDKNKLCMGAN